MFYIIHNFDTFKILCQKIFAQARSLPTAQLYKVEKVNGWRFAEINDIV